MQNSNLRKEDIVGKFNICNIINSTELKFIGGAGSPPMLESEV